jgi:hypothetical protein
VGCPSHWNKGNKIERRCKNKQYEQRPDVADPAQVFASSIIISNQSTNDAVLQQSVEKIVKKISILPFSNKANRNLTTKPNPSIAT